jgi:hypothetical protein
MSATNKDTCTCRDWQVAEGSPDRYCPAHGDQDACYYCCHSHKSGEVCDYEYPYVAGLGRDWCSCSAEHHTAVA